MVAGILRRLAAPAAAVLLIVAVAGCTPPANVALLIANVHPDRSAFHLHDSNGNTMDTLKVVEDPTTAGRYLGVYHTYTGSTYLSSVATSTDLKNWTFKRTFDLAASQPYLAFGPGNVPVVADEAFTNAHIRFFYWSSVSALLNPATPPVDRLDTTRSLSSCAEGTPDIRSITGSSVATSQMIIGHHYFENCVTDRQAIGILQNFSTWGTATNPSLDSDMTAAGAPGKHGDRDVFRAYGNDYVLAEGSINTTPGTFDFSDWRNYIWDGDTATEIGPNTPNGSTAFANPSTTILHAPNGVLSLVVTEFIPTSGAGTGESGELIYWNPL